MARQPFDQDTPYQPGQYGGVGATKTHWGGNGPVADAQGNVTGTVIQGTPSGEQSDVSRYRDIGADMQKRDPYKFDWSQSDQSHAQGAQAAAAQNDASNVWRDQATGQDRTSFNYGKSLLDKGAQNQQAGALSTSGGPLAQIGAAARASNGQSAFMQKGTQELEAQHADDMAAGRAGWAGALGQQRKMDATGQSLSDQQTEMEATAAAQQRKLNDAGQYGMEKMGVDVEGQAVAARQHQQATSDKMRQDQQNASDAKDARTMGTFNTVVSTVGNAALPGAGTAFVAGGTAAQEASQGDHPDDGTSDERAKDKLGPNALLEMVQTPGKLFGKSPEPNASYDTESGGQSEYLPSDEISDNYKTAHATDSNTAPAVTGYDNSMFKSHGQADGGDIGTDALHKGIEKGLARDQALDDARKDLANDNKGVGGAPRGYAKSRAGKPGDMFYGGEQASRDGAWDAKHGVAPGTRDYLKYGNIEGPESAMQNARRTTKMDDFSQAVMTSDERAKNKAETPEEKKAREDKQDAEDTAAFMKDTPKGAYTSKKPSTYEEASKAIDERNAQDKQIAETKKREEQAPAVAFTNENNARLQQGADKLRYVPIINKWVQRKVDARVNETDDQKAERGVTDRKEQMKTLSSRAQTDAWAREKLPESVRDWGDKAPVAIGYRPDQDSRQPRRDPVSFERGDKDALKYGETTSDERTKQKASGYEDTQMHSLGVESKDGGDTTLEWDGGTKGRGHSRDVVLGEKPASDSSQGASLSGPTPKYSTPKAVPSAAKPAPGSRATRKYTDAELKKLGEEMLGNTKAQSDAQLGQGPSVSDERAKNKGYKADKGAGGGEEEHDGTTWEHRGPAVTEAPPVASDSPRGVPGGGEAHENDRTSIQRTDAPKNPLIEMQKHANRQLRGETYTYKEGFGEDTGQVHHGFMAQNLEQNPITATAVREDGTGVKKVNNEDALRVTAAGVASLQEQHDELEAAIEALVARRGKKKVA